MEIYTDGSCKKNPGPGGWGVYCNDTELCGKEDKTTNNRMEMTAVIEALEHFILCDHIIIHTDSKYVKNGITLWIKKWKLNGWKTATNKDVKNQDLWKKMDLLIDKRINLKTEWLWVKGHTGIKGNERADQLARQY